MGKKTVVKLCTFSSYSQMGVTAADMGTFSLIHTCGICRHFIKPFSYKSFKIHPIYVIMREHRGPHQLFSLTQVKHVQCVGLHCICIAFQFT